jgi:parvulin-like peptidyl-prolyl isomerase
MKLLKLSLSAALCGAVISAHAAAETAVPMTTNAPASPGTNSNPAAAMAALFGDPAIVQAKGFTIKRSDLDQIVSGARANAAAAGQQVPPDFDATVLNQLITIQLLLQKATDADKATGKTDSDAQYQKLLAHFGSVEAFQRQLTAAGITVDQLRAKATQEATAKAALQRELKVAIGDAEVATYYSNHTADFEVPAMVHARHILLLTVDPTTHQPLSDDAIAAKRKQIDDLLKQVKAGGDFAALATQYSEDPGSKANGGELQPFPKGQMVPEFEAVAFSLTNNQISDVVKTSYGFHIIKLLDKTPAHQLTLTSTLPENTNSTVAVAIKEGLTQMQVRKLAPAYIKQLRTDYDVQIVDDTLKAETQAAEAAAAAQAAQPADATTPDAPSIGGTPATNE